MLLPRGVFYGTGTLGSTPRRNARPPPSRPVGSLKGRPSPALARKPYALHLLPHLLPTLGPSVGNRGKPRPSSDFVTGSIPSPLPALAGHPYACHLSGHLPPSSAACSGTLSGHGSSGLPAPASHPVHPLPPSAVEPRKRHFAPSATMNGAARIPGVCAPKRARAGRIRHNVHGIGPTKLSGGMSVLAVFR